MKGIIMQFQYTDYLEMFEAIETDIDDMFHWVNKSFMADIRKYLDKGFELTDNMCQAIYNIYSKGK